MSNRTLDIYKISFELFFKTHPLSLNLPKFESYELGSQLRRSSESVNTNIIEGYGRSVYKKEYERFLIFSHSSCDETIGRLEKIIILYPDLKADFEILRNEYDLLGGKINNYLKWVRNNWDGGNLKNANPKTRNS